ncbi:MULTISPECIES: heme exporter protein CcmD [Shewanella]|jgi:heme exporter protein D|uniref:Heme exporter protein D n=6 Tax=Bacteria TaxID=2 RepID=A0A1S2TX74_9GAMM|nr:MULTISPECIES: heme exporter protein CcmD [Shewanella]AXQ13907.1 heme exporter protein CcmD [Shewanella algae]AYV12025.1 heme exporter protein CcmD [Shewanella algae]EKT4489802.1 heme exporter protein CcmD [Shewanella algae]MBC8797721.1 heme exporter protein CcmD [Shewanella algae]MBO2546450.1 heme exporter protein CcmD [Shewanella algae]
MQFQSLAEFFNMGGYAFYVWLAYGVTFVSLSLLILVSSMKKRRVLQEIASKVQREERLAQNRSNRS